MGIIRKIPKSVSLSENLLKEIEIKRGLASRSAYIEHLLKKALREVENGISN
jgi:metal-responsive CopG/Arc/MetJ family transcriptional regulator